MKRTHLAALVLSASALVLLGGFYIWSTLPYWAGPVVGRTAMDEDAPWGERDCWEISYVFPRSLLQRDSNEVLETRPTYWSDIVIVAFPAWEVVEHGVAGELEVGDTGCSSGGSEAWYYAPTGAVMDFGCSKMDWPDCSVRAPKFKDIPGK